MSATADATQVPPGIAANPRLVPRVLMFGALSKRKGGQDHPDQESIASQIARQRAKVESEYREGWELIPDGTRDYFEDTGYSGSKRNRGPGLERALRRAVELANDATGRPVELWANTPARFARGSGKKNQSRSILELFVHLQREGVTLRAVNDDDLVRREELVGFASRMAAKYSEDLRESVERANLRKLAAGEHLGGPLSDGYRMLYGYDDAGRIVSRTPEIDPERGPIWREAYELSAANVSDGEIARRFNAKGYTKRSGAPWDARAIRNGLTNPWYCGKIAHRRFQPDERIYDGRHPPIVDVATFNAIQASRGLRQIAPEFDRTGGGRPPENHALAQLAFCRCGEPMQAKTSNYVRKDGTRRRTYTCRAVVLGLGTCDMPPIDAEIVDAAIIAELDGLLVDFDAWRARIVGGHAAERERVHREIERADADRKAQATRLANVERTWRDYAGAGDAAAARSALPMVEAEREALILAERRERAARDALALVPDEAPMDAMLDYANDLREAVRGRVTGTETMKEVNEALRSIFAGFVLTPSPYYGPEPEGRIIFGGRPAVEIAPYMSEAMMESLYASRTMPTGKGMWPKWAPIDGDGYAPPLRWLTAGDGPRDARDPESDVTIAAADGATLSKTCTDGCVLARRRQRAPATLSTDPSRSPPARARAGRAASRARRGRAPAARPPPRAPAPARRDPKRAGPRR